MLVVLASIYIFFKPLNIKQQAFVDVPLFEIKDFTMYELDPTGLHTIMLGSTATRYSNRYTVKDIDYTDNKNKEYIANMQANNGIYKNDIVTLTGNVTYTRDDGLTFKTQKAVYNKKTSDVVSNVGYVAYMNDSVLRGSYIKYNNEKNRIFSKNVRAKIQLQER
ncbi:LPS export ABC transporter periplasmic protein LptC [Sulfurimonas paralvinellae]|uniref:LPS export ABC transporter periplasmic protein LptC n=1 Tax=Sulfurimonas paralvinellae TaxID=317658 RepID=A0A7M1B8A2_9BACT|nr:LPS export ABC transporter periplasmic protein LptC [Sulfurimonas paralvinellae]